MMEEYFGINVRAESHRSAPDLLDRLRKKPAALSFGSASVRRQQLHPRSCGPQERRRRGEASEDRELRRRRQSVMALLGGHVDAISTGLSNMGPTSSSKAGCARWSSRPAPHWAVPLPRCRPWREVGVDVVQTSWARHHGRQGHHPRTDRLLGRRLPQVVQTEDWKKEVQENYWANTYAGAARAAPHGRGIRRAEQILRGGWAWPRRRRSEVVKQ